MGRTYRGDDKKRLIEKYTLEREKRNKRKTLLEDDKKSKRNEDDEGFDKYRRYN